MANVALLHHPGPNILKFTCNLFIMILCSSCVSSYTEIQGRINSNERFTLGKSPYLIKSDLMIAPEMQLLIEPGVRIEFLPGVGITVRGKIIARGTSDRKIIFTSKSPGSWRGIPKNIRLIEGSSVLNGRLQLLYKGSWRSVCTNSKNWTQTDLNIACKQLGFGDGRFLKWYNRISNDTKQLLYQSPNCTEGSDSLLQCQWSSRQMGGGVCDDHLDLGIECDPHNDTSGQHWAGISFKDAAVKDEYYLASSLRRKESLSIFEHTQILHAGMNNDGFYTSALQSIGIPPRLSHTEIKWSVYNGLNFTAPTDGFSIKNCKIIQNRGYGVFVNTSQGMAEITSNTLISGNGGDGVRYVFHDLFQSAKDIFCDIPSLGTNQIYPKKLIQHVRRERRQMLPCEKLFTSKGFPGQVLTVHILSMRTDPNSKSALEVYDESAYGQPLLTRFILKNDTRMMSVSSTGKSVLIKFIPDSHKDTYFTIEVTTSIGKAADLNITDGGISNNIGSGVTVENERSSIVVNRTTISGNAHMGLHILGGSGDVYVNNSVVSDNSEDGVNITYAGGKRVLSKTTFYENGGNAIAIWLNRSSEMVFKDQNTDISYSNFSLNRKAGILIGNFCKSDSFVNISMNSFSDSLDSAIIYKSCWETLPSNISPLRLRVSNNAFLQNKKLALQIVPALNLDAIIEHNSFTGHANGVILVENYQMEDYSHLSADILIQYNRFYANNGSFACKIGLTEESVTQKLVFTRNRLYDNIIKEPFPNLSPRSRIAAVVAISSSNTEAYRNMFMNPKSLYELGSHTDGHYITLNATYNYWGSNFDPQVIYNRIFDVKNRYNLAKVEFLQFLEVETDMETNRVSNVYGEQNIMSFREGQVIGGEVMGEVQLEAGEYEVTRDIYVKSGSTLLIRPGAVLKFKQSLGMMVQGRLESVGSSTNQIKYTYHSNDRQVATDVPLKLTSGNEGKVLMRIGDKWGTICRYGWTMKHAALVCHQLGLVLNPNDWILEKIDVYNVSIVDEISGILLNKVQCDDLDTDITNCKSETVKDFENSCSEEVAIRCYEPSWAGIRFGMMAENSKLEESVIEKAGLFDYITNNFKPGVQVDFNRHSLKKLTLTENFDSGMAVKYNDLFYNKEQQHLRGSVVMSNKMHGVVTRSQGFAVRECTLTNNGGSAIHYHPKILNEEHKDLMRWIYLQDSRRIINVTEATDGKIVHLQPDDKRFFVIRPDGQYDSSRSKIKFRITTKYINILGIQILKPINRLSTEEVVIYDYQDVQEDKIKWNLKQNLTVFPRVSTSFTITIVYHPGNNPIGSILLYISSISREDFDVTFNPKIWIQKNKIENCGDGISIVHFNRDVGENGDLYLRNANESIVVTDTTFTNNKGPMIFVNTPFLDPSVTNLAEINITISNVTAKGNGGIITQFSRDSRNSNNLFHWKMNQSTFEDNHSKGIKINMPYVWQYNENYTHSVNFSDNIFQNNKQFGLSMMGQFAKVEMGRNKFILNKCTRGLIDIGGMEKEMLIIGNNIRENAGHHMVRFNMHSHSSMFGTVPADFVYNTLEKNRYYSPRHDYDDQGYYPSSFTLGIFGIQQINLTTNLFSDNQLQFELLAGVKTGSIKNEINVANNWWGTVDVSEIQAKIFDFDDWNSYAIAKFMPFLTAAGFDVPSRDIDIKEKDVDLSKPLGGRIYKSLDLPKRSDPYIVKSDLTIMPGATLSIDAGVDIQLYPSVGILVLGKLIAIGRSDSRITLKPVVRPNYPARYKRDAKHPQVRLCIDEKCNEKRQNGYLEIYNATTLHWVPVCDDRFTEWNAQVVCHELGYSTTNVYLGSSQRNDMLFSHNRLNLVRYWPEPLQCEGDEARYSDCELRMNGYFDHDHRCFANSKYMYISCGELNIKDVEYWGGIRFSVPNFEQKQINLRHQLQPTEAQSMSILEYVDVIGAGILHGYKSGAVQTSLTTVHINHVTISQSASHGISSIAAVGEIHMYDNKVYNNLGIGLNVLLLYGASVTGDNLMYPPVRTVSIPYHVFGMVDICDTNKELIVEGRILLNYKYTNSPVDCVKILSSKYGTKPLGFRLLHFNLFDSSHWSLAQDVIRLYDGDVFNYTIPTIAELWALKGHEQEQDEHEADHHRRSGQYYDEEPMYHRKFYKSTEGTLSIALHASGASGSNGFIAEVITLDNSHSINHGLNHNFTKCVFENNIEGAVQYANAGEGIAKVAFHLNTFENNGKKLYGNFTTSDGAVRIKVQNTPDILIVNNAFRKNQGGLVLTSYGATWRSSLNGYISNNLFLENQNREALLIRGYRSLASNQKINVALNTFALNNAPYRDTIVFSQVLSNFTLNLIMNNTGRHNLDVHWFYSLSSQRCVNNWFHYNKALMPRNRATIIASTGGQIFRHNFLVNPDNDFELSALNRSRYRRPGETEESISATNNWWGYNSTIAVIGRIRDQYDEIELLPVDHGKFYMNNRTVLSDHGKCGPGYTLVGKTCILFVGGILRFHDAKKFCESSDGALPFIRGNEEILSEFVAKQQQYNYERYLKVWIQSVDVPVGSCPILLDGDVHKNDCDELLPFLCEKDPDIIISFDLWYQDVMTIIALSVVGCAIILLVPCIAFWCCKSKRRHQEKLERRNSIRASIRSNRNANGFGELGYKRRFDAHHQPPARATAFKISNSFTNGSIDSIEKNPSRFDSSVEDNRSYEIYEAHNSRITFPKYDEKYVDDKPAPAYDDKYSDPHLEDKFRDDPRLEEENIKMTVNPTFDYAIPNKGYLDRSYSQPSHDSSHDWGSTDSNFDTKHSIDFSQMLNGFNGYHDSATLPRNTPSAESAVSHDTKKSQPLETAM